MVPNGWLSSKLGEVCHVINGRPFKPHEWKESGIPIIRIQNLNGSKVYNYYDGDFSDKVLIKSGQLLFAWSGSKGTSFGPHIWSGPNGLLNYHTWRMNVKDTVDSDFFYQYLRVITSKIENKSHGASALVHTQKGEMEKFPVVLPPLPEQQKIAKILSTWDKAITTTEKLIETSKQQKKSLMQQLLTGKKRLLNPETGKAFEGEWEEVKFGACIEHTGGTALEKHVINDAQHHFISIGNYSMDGKYIDKGQRIELNSKTKTKLLNKNDLVMVLNDKTKTGDIIGSTILIDEDNKYIYNQRSERIVPDKAISVSFFWYLLNSAHIRTEVFSRSQGGTQIYVNFGALKSIYLNLPQKDEQQKIASVLTTADKEIELLETKLAHLKQEKKALMQQLLTGKRRVEIDNTEAA